MLAVWDSPPTRHAIDRCPAAANRTKGHISCHAWSPSPGTIRGSAASRRCSALSGWPKGAKGNCLHFGSVSALAERGQSWNQWAARTRQPRCGTPPHHQTREPRGPRRLFEQVRRERRVSLAGIPCAINAQRVNRCDQIYQPRARQVSRLCTSSARPGPSSPSSAAALAPPSDAGSQSQPPSRPHQPHRQATGPERGVLWGKRAPAASSATRYVIPASSSAGSCG